MEKNKNVIFYTSVRLQHIFLISIILVLIILILIILVLIILVLIIFMGKMMKFTIISTEAFSFGGFLFFGSERVIPVRRVWINGDISK